MAVATRRSTATCGSTCTTSTTGRCSLTSLSWRRRCRAFSSAGSPLQAVAFTAAGIALAARLGRRRYPLFGALASGLAALTALHLRWPSVSLLPSAVAAVALIPIIVSGTLRLHHQVRTRTFRVAGIVAGAAALCGVVGVISLLSVRSQASRGLADARTAIDAARRGDASTASADVEAAAHRLASAKRVLDSPWTIPARGLPVVAQQMRAVRTMADTAHDLSET